MSPSPYQKSKSDLLAEKEELLKFISSLDEQYGSGLLLENTYKNLKAKYENEVRDLTTKINQITEDAKKINRP